jgi:hypothetical protein
VVISSMTVHASIAAIVSFSVGATSDKAILPCILEDRPDGGWKQKEWIVYLCA